MTENRTPHAWRAWLESQDTRQLDTSLIERERLALSQEVGSEDHNHTLREIEMIREEFARRKEAERVREEFFPRVTMRNAKDAQLMAQLLHAHALELLDSMQSVMQLKMAQDMGLPITATFIGRVSGQGTQDADQVLSDLGKRAVDTADFLAAVSSELMRLNDDSGIALTDEEKNSFDAIIEMIKKMETEK